MNIVFAEMIEDDKIREDFYAFVEKYKVTRMTRVGIESTKPTTAFREVLNMTDLVLQDYLLSYFYIRKCGNKSLLAEMIERVKSLTISERKSLDKFLKKSTSIENDYNKFVSERRKLLEKEAKMDSCLSLNPFKIKKIFNNFEDMGYKTVSEFLLKNSLRCTGDQLLDYLKVNGYSCEYNFLSKLKESSLNKAKVHFLGIKAIVEREYNRIHNGIEEEGQVRAYDMLDYYENCKFKKADFMGYCKKFGLRITPQLHNFFKYSVFCTEEEILSGKYIISGREISKNEMIEAINYLKAKSVPLSSMLFSLALKRTLK